MTPDEVIEYINEQIRNQTGAKSITPASVSNSMNAIINMDLPQTDGTTPPEFGQINIAYQGNMILFWNGAIWKEIGRIGLQATTDGTGNNITSNTAQFTGVGNANLAIRSLVVYNGGMQLIDNGVVIGGLTIGGSTGIAFGSSNVSLTSANLISNVPIVTPDAIEDTEAINKGQLKNISFFAAATTSTTLINADIVNKRVLKIEGFGVFYYEGQDFTKLEASDTINMTNGQQLIPSSQYLLTTSYF